MRIFKNKWAITIAITVILILLIILSANPESPTNFIYKAVSVPLQPVQQFFSGAARRISDTTSYFFNYGNEEGDVSGVVESEEIDRLQKELDKIKQENDEMKKMLELTETAKDYTYIAATVIASDVDNWYDVFTINKGSSSGIKLYDCVVTSNGLVGKVMSVAPNSAKVMSIVNEESTLIASLSKTNDKIRIRGTETLTTEIECKVDNIDSTVDISVGDLIETAESGGVYPKGIIIGKVKKIIKMENNVVKALVDPAVDFKRLDKVMVMSKNE